MEKGLSKSQRLSKKTFISKIQEGNFNKELIAKILIHEKTFQGLCSYLKWYQINDLIP